MRRSELDRLQQGENKVMLLLKRIEERITMKNGIMLIVSVVFMYFLCSVRPNPVCAFSGSAGVDGSGNIGNDFHTNRDGKISKDEFDAAGKRLFDRLENDSSNILTKEKLLLGLSPNDAANF